MHSPHSLPLPPPHPPPPHLETASTSLNSSSEVWESYASLPTPHPSSPTSSRYSPSSASTPAMPSPLPRELIEQIFQEENPTKHALAKICLLNWSFLDFGRRLLYCSVQVTVIAQYAKGNENDVDDDEDEWGGLVVLWYLEAQTARLFDIVKMKPALAALVKDIDIEKYSTGDGFAGSGSRHFAKDSESLFLDVLTALPNVKSLKLPRYINGYVTICEWYMNAPWLVLEHLDARAVGGGALDLLESFQDVKHLSFTSKAEFPVIAPAPFFEKLDELRLESLHIARPDANLRHVFDLLTASSVSTLRTLRLPWHPQGAPSDFSAFTSLASFELSELSDTPCEELVRTFTTFPPSLISLSLLSFSNTPFSHLVVVAQHVPTSVLSLELPHVLDYADVIRFVEQLPSGSKVRFLSVETVSEGQEAFAAVRAACVARGIAFSTFRRLEV